LNGALPVESMEFPSPTYWAADVRLEPRVWNLSRAPDRSWAHVSLESVRSWLLASGGCVVRNQPKEAGRIERVSRGVITQGQFLGRAGGADELPEFPRGHR